MSRLAALPLAFLAACGIGEVAGIHDLDFAAGATRTSPWHVTDEVRTSHEDLARTIRELIVRCGYKLPDSSPADDRYVTDWDVQMSAHWRDSMRSKLEIEILPGGTKGTFVVRSRNWMEINNNMLAPSDPDKAEWVGAGVSDQHKDRINEPGLRFHSLLKFRLFGLNQ